MVVESSDAWIGIISSGITYWEVREALAVIGLGSEEEVAAAGIRMLRMGMPIPFNASVIRDFAAGLEEIFVIRGEDPQRGIAGQRRPLQHLASAPDRGRVRRARPPAW